MAQAVAAADELPQLDIPRLYRSRTPANAAFSLKVNATDAVTSDGNTT